MPGTTLISPNYPNSYGIYLSCQITLTFEDRVVIKFEDFDLNDDYDCSYDWLEVRDGDDSNSEMIGDKLCGHDIPDPIESTGSSITLIFDSNDVYHPDDTGFKIIADLGKYYNYGPVSMSTFSLNYIRTYQYNPYNVFNIFSLMF